MLNVSVVGSRSEDLVAAFRERGIRVSSVDFEQFERAHPAGSAGPDAFVVDIRQMAGLPRDIGQMRRLFPASGIIIVACTVESADLLEAMRIGVNEWDGWMRSSMSRHFMRRMSASAVTPNFAKRI